MNRKEFIDYIAPVIVADSNKRNLLPSPRIAQAILESASGTSELAVKAKNLFGLKDNNQWGGKVYNKATGEYYSGSYTTITANFQAYDTWEDSVYWQGWYLENRKFSASSKTTVYGALQGVRDYKEFCKLLKSCGYATSPNYAENLINVIESEGLTKYDVLDQPTTTTPQNMPVGKLALTVGHSKLKNGSYTSANGKPFGGVLEYEYNKELAPLIQKWMRAGGWECDVIVCPEGKFAAAKEESTYKLNIVNDASKGYDLVCELHLNASGAHNASGEEVLYISASGKKYAEAVSAKISTMIKRHSAGIVYRDNLYMLTKTKPVAIMIESFFCDNKSDCAAMADKNRLAKLIAEGIVGHTISETNTAPISPAPTTPNVVTPTPAPTPEPSASTKPDTSNSSTVTGGPYWIQVGAFGLKDNANNRVNQLKNVGIAAFVRSEKNSNNLWVIQAGKFANKDNADAHKKLIESKGFQTIMHDESKEK